MIPPFRFESASLLRLAAEHRDQFRLAVPFPHAVFPNFLPLDIADALAAEFPAPDAIDWLLAGPGAANHSHDPEVEKISSSDEATFPPLIRHVMHEFNSGTFVHFLSELTSTPGLIPDPDFSGCGMHSTGRGGRLMIHADASRHPNKRFDQAVNAIYYVTPNWEKAFGGDLELWDKTASNCITRISPLFNSLVVFLTGSNCYHGHPTPLLAPRGVRRNSLAAYYYVLDRPRGADYAGHRGKVLWKPTNELDRRQSISQAAVDFARRLFRHR